MAKDIIEIEAKVKVDSNESVKSLSDLKKEFKDIQSELTGLQPGTEKYVQTLQRLGAVKDEIGDLRSEIQAFAGADAKIGAVTNVVGGLASGFAAAQGAAALFGSESEDLQKSLVKVQSAMAFAEGIKGLAGLSDGFKVLGNVIKANPLMLITTIVLGIGTALFALKDKIAVVGKAFDFFGGVINNVIESVKTFTDWIGISSFKADEANEKLIANAEKAKAAITERYDAEIRAAKRAGKETEEIEESKIRNLYLQNNKQIVALRDLGNKRTDEQNKQFIELVNQNKEYYQDLLDLEDAQNDKIAEKQRQANEKAREAARKKAEEDRRQKEEEDKWKREFEKEVLRREAEMDKEFYKEQFEKEKEQLKAEDERIEAEIQADIKKFEEDKKRRLQAIEDYKKGEQQKVELTKQGLNAIISLTDAFAGKDEASQRKAFNIKKAASLALATIETYQAAQSAYTSQMSIPTPDAPIRAAVAAGLAVVQGFARVAVISRTKFEGGGGAATGSTGGGASLGTFTQGSTGQPPQGLTTQNNVTQLNPDGTVAGSQTQSQTVKAYVVESESRAVTERVNKLSNQSKIG